MIKKPAFPKAKYARLTFNTCKFAYGGPEKLQPGTPATGRKVARLILVRNGEQVDMHCSKELAKEALAQDVATHGGPFTGLRDNIMIAVCEARKGCQLSGDPDDLKAVVMHRMPAYGWIGKATPKDQVELAAERDPKVTIRISPAGGMFVESFPAKKVTRQQVVRILEEIDQLEEIQNGTKLGSIGKVASADDDLIVVTSLAKTDTAPLRQSLEEVSA